MKKIFLTILIFFALTPAAFAIPPFPGGSTGTGDVTGPTTPTAGYLTKWGPSGKALVDSVNPSTLLASTYGPVYCVDAGSANALAATCLPTVTLGDGLVAYVRVANTNTTTTPTFAYNSGTARTIYKQGAQALVAGDLPVSPGEAILKYNLANTRWELLNPVYPPGQKGCTPGSGDCMAGALKNTVTPVCPTGTGSGKITWDTNGVAYNCNDTSATPTLMGACVPTVLDLHAAGVTITAAQLQNCNSAILHNSGQAAANVNNTLPAISSDGGFIAQVRTAQASNYWRLTAASAGTVCLDGLCGLNYIDFPAPATTQLVVCVSNGTAWICKTIGTYLSAPILADTTLSGTPIVFTMYDQTTGVPYYFKAYPTKP